MSKCFKCNKYICLYIYICLFHFVVNEDKYYFRYDGEPKMKWEFTLDLNTDGGLKLSNQLKEKEIIISFYTSKKPTSIFGTYSLLNDQSSKGTVETIPGYIIAADTNLYIVLNSNNQPFTQSQKIGQLINAGVFSKEVDSIPNDGSFNLVLEYERIEEPEPKIAEINIKIISIIIGGLIILIILLIIKLIAK